MSHGGIETGRFDFDAYRRYMRSSRCYAMSTVKFRTVIAREWLGRHPDLDAVSHVEVEQWVADRGLGPSSTRNALVALRALYRWAMREGICHSDPTQLADRPRVPQRLPRPAAEQDIARVQRDADPQLAAILALMACAGLRCLECSRLDWSDVDLGAGTVIVYGKGSKERLIDLSADVIRALSAHALAAPGRRVGAVFAGPTGRRMSPARVSQLVNRSFRAVGLTTRAHQLRHRCATLALQQPDADLLDVRDLLGHSSVATTQVYTAVVPGRTAKVSRALRMPGAAA